MNRIDLFKKRLEEKNAVKIIAGIDNYDVEKVAKVVTAAEQGGADAVDIAASQELIEKARELTSLPIFVSSISPMELAHAVQCGADAIEIGNFDAMYKKGLRISANEVYEVVLTTLSLINKEDVFVCVTIPGHISVNEQIELAHKLEDLGIDLIQTEGAAIADVHNNGARGLLETAQVSIANTIELARNVEIPVMTASGITPTTSALAFAAGASAIGVGSCVNKLNTTIEMIAAVKSLVNTTNRAKVSELV